jgi:hypothetical protein
VADGCELQDVALPIVFRHRLRGVLDFGGVGGAKAKRKIALSRQGSAASENKGRRGAPGSFAHATPGGERAPMSFVPCLDNPETLNSSNRSLTIKEIWMLADRAHRRELP